MLLLSSPSQSILLFVLVILIVQRVLLCKGDNNDGRYTDCARSFNCGTITNITYPFWGGGRPQFCGLQGFMLECSEYEYPIFEFQAQKYQVLKIDHGHRTMTIARMDLMDGVCLSEFSNTSMMDSTLFHMTATDKNLSIFYGCLGTGKNISNEFECLYDDSRKSAFFTEDTSLNKQLRINLTSCITSIKVPVLQSSLDGLARGNINLREVLNRGFDAQYLDQPPCSACNSSGGFCGSDSSSSSSSFKCYCRDKPHARTCNDPGTLLW